jgi:hypothetical protein
MLPVQNVLSQGQTLHCPAQQYSPLGQQRPSQQTGWVEGQHVRRSAPPQKLVLEGQGTH